MSYDFLWKEDATEEEVLAGYQELVNTGVAWHLEGHVGRTAMGLIESGKIMLGLIGHHNYWGSYIPSRYEVPPGTVGSQEYMERISAEG